jgi:tetratricopeptide (TPR) repeat protein
MSKPRIAVYTIALNQVGSVERFMASCAEADVVTVGDAGSDDGTPEQLAALGAAVRRIAVQPWRFDLARNAVLALVPRDVDVCVKLDLDEVLLPGWRAALEAAWQPGVTRLRYQYGWSRGEASPESYAFATDNIHSRSGYRGNFPCFETLSYYDNQPETTVDAPGLGVRQYGDAAGLSFNLLDLLNLAVRENSFSDRMTFYYGRELYFQEHWELAEHELERYLRLATAVWPPERSQAMILLARCCNARQQPEQALRWLLRAVAECPTRREVWCELAQEHHNRQQWGQCYAASLEALQISEPDRGYVVEERVWRALPHDLAAVAAYQLGLYQAALEQGQRAVEHEPDEQRLRDNLGFYAAKLADGGPARARRGRQRSTTG